MCELGGVFNFFKFKILTLSKDYEIIAVSVVGTYHVEGGIFKGNI